MYLAYTVYLSEVSGIYFLMLKCTSEVSPGGCLSFKHEDKMFQKLINFSLFIVSQDEVIFFSCISSANPIKFVLL